MNSSAGHARFYVLLNQMPHEDKDSIVSRYSRSATTSLRVLYTEQPAEYRRMIDDMQRVVDDLKGENSRLERRAELKRLRSAILLRLQKYGVNTADWSDVNRFMRQPRIAGKTLGEMGADELRAFIPKMESILSKQQQHGTD
jgi:hypothetical protein